MLAAIEHGRPGEAYNIVDDAPIGFGEHLAATATAFGTPKPLAVPAWMLSPLRLLSAMLKTDLRLSNAKARDELGWTPRYPTVPDGLAAMVGPASRTWHPEAMTDVFTDHRDLLFSVAYRMTGSVADAEDIVQDAWLRWSATDREAVRAPVPYLVKTVTNLAVNELTSARARRETYVGPWLPEPLLTGRAPMPAGHVPRRWRWRSRSRSRCWSCWRA